MWKRKFFNILKIAPRHYPTRHVWLASESSILITLFALAVLACTNLWCESGWLALTPARKSRRSFVVLIPLMQKERNREEERKLRWSIKTWIYLFFFSCAAPNKNLRCREKKEIWQNREIIFSRVAKFFADKDEEKFREIPRSSKMLTRSNKFSQSPFNTMRRFYFGADKREWVREESQDQQHV